MPIVENLDVMMAKRKVPLERSSGASGNSLANLSS